MYTSIKIYQSGQEDHKHLQNTQELQNQELSHIMQKSESASFPGSVDHQQCKVAAALAVLGGKWKLPLIKQLTQGTKRYNELSRDLEGITQRMLTKQLRELEEDGVVSRKVYPEIPPKVEYSLTQAGRDLQNVIQELEIWGGKHLSKKHISENHGER